MKTIENSFNSGIFNSGDYNSGSFNSGDYNSGDYNSGFFNTESNLGYLFNKPAIITNEIRTKLHLLNVKPSLMWVNSLDMTSEEKEKNPSYKTTGGFLRDLRKTDYSTLTQEDKDFIKSLPNYNDEIFFQITGIRLLEPKKIKITYLGSEIEIDKSIAEKIGLLEILKEADKKP